MKLPPPERTIIAVAVVYCVIFLIYSLFCYLWG